MAIRNILRLPAVEKATGNKKSQIYALMASGDFPPSDWFCPGPDWCDVPPGATLVAGCEIRLDMTTGSQQARRLP